MQAWALKFVWKKSVEKSILVNISIILSLPILSNSFNHLNFFIIFH